MLENGLFSHTPLLFDDPALGEPARISTSNLYSAKNREVGVGYRTVKIS